MEGCASCWVNTGRTYIHCTFVSTQVGSSTLQTAASSQTILPLASQFEQDEYAWAMMSNCTIDQGMSWSNAMAYGAAHDLVPWVEADLRLLTLYSGACLSDLELWAQYGGALLQALGVSDLFDESGSHASHGSDSWVQTTIDDDSLKCYETLGSDSWVETPSNIGDDDLLKCYETLEDDETLEDETLEGSPMCKRKLGFIEYEGLPPTL